MKKKTRALITATLTLFAFLLMLQQTDAQQKTARKKKTIELKASSKTSEEADALLRPQNEKNPKPEAKSRGDKYGRNYSDIIIDNWTGYAIDIFVDREYRGTVGAYDKNVTWAIPGDTRLYGKVTFSDGTYLTWGPTVTNTGYEYTWKLTN